MSPSLRHAFRTARAPAALALAAFALGGCGSDSASPPTGATTTSAQPPPTTATATTPPRHHNPHHRERPRKPRHAEKPRYPPGVASALRDYVAALDAHDGERLCALFQPGALDTLKLPEGSGCSGLSASIGFRGPHGLPVWRTARVAGIKSVVHSGAGIRATVTIVDRYARNPQPSIEDDVVFLVQRGGQWLIEKPSITIYRAIGTPDPPPSVLAAP